MKPIIAILPTKKISDTILRVRKEITRRGWTSGESRINTIPHASLYYFKEFSDPNVFQKILSRLKKIDINQPPIDLETIRVRQTWNKKIILMLDNRRAVKLYFQIANILNDLALTENQDILAGLNNVEKPAGEKTYLSFDEITGDHIKIIHNIKNEYLQDAIDYISATLPPSITFSRLVFMDQGCRREDIFWQKKLK